MDSMGQESRGRTVSCACEKSRRCAVVPACGMLVLGSLQRVERRVVWETVVQDHRMLVTRRRSTSALIVVSLMYEFLPATSSGFDTNPTQANEHHRPEIESQPNQPYPLGPKTEVAEAH